MGIFSPISLLFIHTTTFICAAFLLASAIFFATSQKRKVLYSFVVSIGALIYHHPIGMLLIIVFCCAALRGKNKRWVVFLEIGFIIIFLKQLFIFLRSTEYISEEAVAQYAGIPVDWVFIIVLTATILGHCLSTVSLFFLARESQQA
jgi:hypothetical protein